MTANDRLLKIDEVIAQTNICRTTIYKFIREGQFPSPVRVGAKAVRWRQSDINEYLASLPPLLPEAA